MNESFFDDFAHARTPDRLFPDCGRCKLFESCRNPKMTPGGDGRRRILLVGESPGDVDDARGRWFSGEAGRFLEAALAEAGIDMRKDCRSTAALVCRTAERPTAAQIECCRPRLTSDIAEFDPDVIIPLGAAALASVLQIAWKESPPGIGQCVGRRIPSREPNAWMCPTWNPGFLRAEAEKNPVYFPAFVSHLTRAGNLKGKPWRSIPDDAAKVECLFRDDEAADAVAGFVGKDEVAFDYETNMLKPDSRDAAIISCSVSNGERTVAFPWLPKARKAVFRLLRSGTPMVASNLPFEERWTIEEFGKGVKRWDWCTLMTAHALDNRAGVCSIKFQAFVRFGAPVWDADIAAFKAGPGSNAPNRLGDVPLGKLLVYNGLDSYYEHATCLAQKKECRWNGSG